MKGTACKSCGKQILFVKDLDGKTHPLDQVAPVFEVVESDSGPIARRAKSSYVSHFATCPQASEHSKTGSKGGRTINEERGEMAAPGTVYVWGGESFDERETLKKWGFRWEADHKRWSCKVSDDRIDRCVEAVRGICPNATVGTGSGVR